MVFKRTHHVDQLSIFGISNLIPYWSRRWSWLLKWWLRTTHFIILLICLDIWNRYWIRFHGVRYITKKIDVLVAVCVIYSLTDVTIYISFRLHVIPDTAWHMKCKFFVTRNTLYVHLNGSIKTAQASFGILKWKLCVLTKMSNPHALECRNYVSLTHWLTTYS